MIEKLKKSKFFRAVLIAIANVLSVVNAVLPKSSKRILFFDSGRDYLDDNTEAFYTWLKNNGYDKKYKLICCVPKETVKKPFSDYQPIGNIKGVLYYLTTKYVFFSFGDFRIRPSKKQIVVNQWHGTPLKAIGKYTGYSQYTKERLDNFTYLLAASDTFVPIMAKAFGCSEDKVAVIGHTRTDYFSSNKNALEILGINKGDYEKLVLWMPTFRVSKDNRFHDTDCELSETKLSVIGTFEQLKKLDELLNRKNMLMVIKVHPYADMSGCEEYTNIRIMVNDDIIPKGVKLYEFIKEFDALVTDFSSIYCDYMLLDRPIGFTLDDIDSYTRGFIFDNLTDYMPGHRIFDEQGIYRFLEDVSCENDEYKKERDRLQPFFNKYTDADKCRRLAQLCEL